MKRFTWKASSSDGSYEACSKTEFSTEKEAYEDMRNAALEKMKWNTEYDDDFDDEQEGNDTIGYEVKFTRKSIVHISYSGTYTFEIVENDYAYVISDTNNKHGYAITFGNIFTVFLDFDKVICEFDRRVEKLIESYKECGIYDESKVSRRSDYFHIENKNNANEWNELQIVKSPLK